MEDACDILGAAAELHDRDGFVNHVAGVGGKNMHTQQFVGAGVGDDFDKPIRFIHRLGTSICKEWEFSDPHFAMRLRLFFRQSD